MGIDPRIQMSLERTMLSWTRTGLALMGFGFIVSRFSMDPKEEVSLWIGILSIFLGFVVSLGAGLQYSQYLKHLQESNSIEERKWPLERILTLFLGIIGLGLCLHFLMIVL